MILSLAAKLRRMVHACPRRIGRPSIAEEHPEWVLTVTSQLSASDDDVMEEVFVVDMLTAGYESGGRLKGYPLPNAWKSTLPRGSRPVWRPAAAWSRFQPAELICRWYRGWSASR
jgi:hypothetical protein